MNWQFFRIDVTYNKLPCVRPDSFNVTSRDIINGTTFLVISIINLFCHSFLLSVMIYNWKAAFNKDFIYKLMLIMSSIAITNTIIHFIMTVPCTMNGCLYYSSRLMEFFTCTWETLEFGFFWVVFFISIDRFFTFYFQSHAKYFRKAWSIVLVLILGFCAQLIRFFMGCPKMYYVELFDTLPCFDCYIFGVSWHEGSRGTVYSLPYLMFIIYALIFVKIALLRTKFFINTNKKIRKADKVLAVQFFILCLIQLLCGSLQYFLNEDATNYVGLIVISLPMDVQILNALILLSSNQVIRKGIETLVCRKKPQQKMFFTAIGPPSSTKLRWGRIRTRDMETTFKAK